MATKGISIYISTGTSSTPIAGTRSDEIQTQCEVLEVSSPIDGAWRKYITGRKGWSFTVGWLLSTGGDLTKLLNIGTTYTINVYSRDGSTTKRLTGSAICVTCKITNTIGNLCQGSFSFIGTDELATPSS